MNSDKLLRLWEEQQVYMKLKAEGIDPLIDSYPEENYSGWYTLAKIHPSSTGEFSAVGQSFKTPSAPRYRITSTKFYMRKWGSPVGNLVAQLYAHIGTFGDGGKPTGSPLAESNEVAMEDLVAFPSAGLVEFTFPEGQQYEMNVNTPYFIECVVKSATVLDMDNKIHVADDFDEPTHGGNTAFFYNSYWKDDVPDTIFYVYGEEVVVKRGLFKGLFAGVIGKK